MKRIVVSGAVLALAVAGVQAATAAPAQYKVTGGGQILVPAEGGAGSTVAFNARGAETAADGQVQYVNRQAGTGQAQVVKHGIVDCVYAFAPTEDGGSARIGGTWKDGSGRFTIDVIDAGEGKDAGDIVQFRDNADNNCTDDENNDDDNFAPPVGLGRGNVQVHKFDSAESSGEASASKGKGRS